jgi:ABC-type branched-subunit amino acid transport system ATPase component
MAVDDQAAARSRLTAVGREILGVDDRADAAEGTGFRRYCPTFATVVLGLAGGSGLFLVVMWPMLAADVSATLGISRAWFLIVVVGVGLPIGAPLAPKLHGGYRARAVTIAVVGGAVALVAAAFGAGFWELVAAALIGGVSLGVAAATHLVLLADLHPARRRPWVFGQYGAVATATTAGGVALLALAGGPTGLTWRGALLICAAGMVVVAGFTTALRDTGRDEGDVVRLTRRLEDEAGGMGTEVRSIAPPGSALSERERVRRVLGIPSCRPLLHLAGVCGFVFVAMPTYLIAFVQQRFTVTAERAAMLVAAVLLIAAVGSLLLTGRLFGPDRRGLAATARAAAWAAAGSALALALVGVSPAIFVAVAMFAIAGCGLVVALAAVASVVLTVTPDDCRSYATTLLVGSALVGGVVERQLVDSVSARFGVGWALLVIGVVILAIADWTRRAAPTLDHDLDTRVGQIIEQVDVDIARSHGRPVSLLSCSGVDFSYGQLQVLFDVNFSVREGEMVALLGTNGAGKSTLLRAISGIGFPQRGSILYAGTDITYVPADRRVRLGISQLPGGRAVFGPLSVLDNLRVFGYSLGRSHREIEGGIDASFDAFPQLGERRDFVASSLSGGQQQMLGLTRALMLRPRLLLIDELSLGLAPIIVGQLLKMVRRINGEGTSVVLVEQSVNIALSLVDHAYFMERGSIRFDGSAAELLDRADLVRSVFLDGALGRAMTGPTTGWVDP